MRVVVTTNDGFETASDGSRLLLPPLNYDFVARQPNLGTFTVDADAATLERLRHDPRVTAITPDRELRPALAESTAQIHADAAWNSGLTGAGQTIVVVDTGVDGAHPMLSGHVVDEACFTEAAAGGGGACPNGQPEQIGAGAAVPCVGGGCDHGTHVASVAAGSTFGALRGVAPDASVLAVQVFTQTPSGPSTSIGEVLQAFEWAYEQRTRFAIAAINLSVASAAPVVTPCADAAVEQATLRLREVGIAVVVAAGNGGSTSDLAYPACVPGIVECQLGRQRRRAICVRQSFAGTVAVRAGGERHCRGARWCRADQVGHVAGDTARRGRVGTISPARTHGVVRHAPRALRSHGRRGGRGRRSTRPRPGCCASTARSIRARAIHPWRCRARRHRS